jgi:putative endonuclease
MRPEKSTWRLYMLRCADGTLYTGATNDLAGRLERHRAGHGARYTRSRLPVKLVYVEYVRDRSAALRREAALKRLLRRDKLALVAAERGRHEAVAAEIRGLNDRLRSGERGSPTRYRPPQARRVSP